MLQAKCIDDEYRSLIGCKYTKKTCSELEIGKYYDVDSIVMYNFHTDVYLRGFYSVYNSVMFEFYENGVEIDIFNDVRFNPFLRPDNADIN